ncbi:hypothetical protein [Alkalibacillus almallahensis]|uniref:hypothetical protein n=1 Tax=Alkalibacillus almallahensis TaxID=1379154 RepID=UPI0014238F7F|nr:hypothetical protein [Alkalibacillus almallahensis]NIK11501.1 hypothetical protein [Alkalibacillus almallahensis]
MQVELRDDVVLLNISGWTSLFTFRKTLTIPYESIVDVAKTDYRLPLTAIRRTGIRMPHYKGGHFNTSGEKHFVSFHDENRVVVLHLQSHEFDKVVVESKNPDQLIKHLIEQTPQLNN